MVDRLLSIVRIGVLEEVSSHLRRSIIVSNMVFLNISICSLLVVLINLNHGLIALIYGSVSFVSLLCILLNKFRLYIFSRTFFLIFLNVCVFLAASLSSSSIAYADDRLFILTNVLLAGVLFNIREKLFLGLSFLFTVALLIAFDPLRDFVQMLFSFELYSPASAIAYISKFALAGITVFLGVFHFQSVVHYYNEKNEQSIKDKELLIKEIHHRVKNNLQVISSLLNLQSNYLESDLHGNVFQNTQNRVKTIAIVHEKLYKSDDLKHINLVEYLTSVIDLISSSFEKDSIEISYSIQENSSDKFSIEKAIPCGLIVNEIITNSYKHAFKGKDKGQINLSFVKLEDCYQMKITDDGIGLNDLDKFSNSNSLGYELIDSLVAQLDGDFVFDSAIGKGTEIVIEFP